MRVEGKILKIKTYNRDSRWGKIQIEDDNLGPVNVIGVIPDNIIEGRRFRIEGEDQEHPKYGYQIKMERSTELESGPQSQDDLISFLSHFRGIGSAIAGRIWDTWGKDSEDILRKSPHLLVGISGISEKMAIEIEDQVASMGRDGDLVSLMVKHRLPMRFLEPLKKRFGRSAVKILEGGAYELMKIRGIGFITADRIGQRQGFEFDSTERIRAGLLHTLDSSLNGSMYTDSIDLVMDTKKLLGGSSDSRKVSIKALQREMDELVRTRELICERPGEVIPRETVEEDCYGVMNYRIETGVAKRIWEMHLSPIEELPVIAPMWDQLSEEQIEAVKQTLSSRVSLITGSAGSGKTTVLKEILAQTANEAAIVVCFTGRAAQRVQELSGFEECSTIHRALKFRPGTGFVHNEKNPIEADIILVDEASMVGLDLTLSLLKAVSSGRQRIVFTGDPSQLPSISNGNLLHELVDCGVIPTTELSYVYRNQSTILDNANRIRVGDPGLVYDSTFRYHPDDDPITVLNRYYKTPKNTMVLSGCKEGNNGVKDLNNWLQAHVGIKGAVPIAAGYTINVGDKVIHTKNNYTKMVFNGNIGWVTRVTAIPGEEPSVSVEYREGMVKTVLYTGKKELEELELAYCLTVHKSQGAEAHEVFMILEPGHYPVQSRNWLYTGVTRAQKQVHMIGPNQVLHRCISSPDVSHNRSSKLGLRIQSLNSQLEEEERYVA